MDFCYKIVAPRMRRMESVSRIPISSPYYVTYELGKKTTAALGSSLFVFKSLPMAIKYAQDECTCLGIVLSCEHAEMKPIQATCWLPSDFEKFWKAFNDDKLISVPHHIIRNAYQVFCTSWVMPYKIEWVDSRAYDLLL